MTGNQRRIAVAVFSMAVASGHASAQQPPSGGGIEVLQLQPNRYLIAGAGGNIVAQVGQDAL